VVWAPAPSGRAPRPPPHVRTNQAVPRAVVLEELRDAALATIHPDDRAAFAPHLEIDHPRQAFDERCFIAGALVADVPWGFDRHDLAGAEARRHRTAASPPFITAPLVAHPNNVVELADLQSFVKHPVAWFVSQRLEARVPRSEEARITLLPVAPTPLEKWKLGDALLAARRAGMTSEEWARIERRRGTIPPGSLGEQLIGTVTAAVDQLLQTTLTLGIAAGAGSAVPIDIMLPDGSRIVGEVRTHLGPPVRGPARVTYSTPKLDYRVSAWLDLMALVANHPDIKWRSVVVSRTGQVRRPVDVVEFTPRDSGAGIAATAIAALALVVECFRQGNDEPIPLFPAFSEKVYLDTHRPADWAGDFGRCETAHPATGLAYGGYEFEDVMALPARMDDPAGPGGRVERLAHAFFGTMESSATAEMVP
jgi:exodeoxyribonuclease V gamma subunit